MIHRLLLCMFLFSLVASAQPAGLSYDGTGDTWSWGYGSEEGGSGSSYLGVDIADVSDRIAALSLQGPAACSRAAMRVPWPSRWP